MEQTIIIAGAGAAGLMAARELSQKGYRVIITEANNRLGGRMHTISHGNFNENAEAGAEFIHGKLPITLKLLAEANIAYERVAGEMYQVKNGQWSVQEEMAPHWDEFMKKLINLKTDMTIADFLQQYFSAAHYKDLREAVQRFAEGFDVADISKASILAVREEWQDDMEDTFRVTGGYGQLVDYLKNQCMAAGCELLTGFAVKKIEWRKNEVTCTAADGRRVAGNKIIVTIPLGILQRDEIEFSPAIETYMQAAKQIGVGSVIKILFQFKEAFWQEYADDAGFIFTEDIVPTWWTPSPSKNALLTGWFGGQQIVRVQHLSDEAILKTALQSLAKTVNRPEQELQDLLISQEVHNWSNNPFARGAYSYSTLQTAQARKIFQEPIDDTIYFAGEGYHPTASLGTVESAFESSLQMVKLI